MKKKYFIQINVGYRSQELRFDTIEEASAFADAYMSAYVKDEDDKSNYVTLMIGMYFDDEEDPNGDTAEDYTTTEEEKED